MTTSVSSPSILLVGSASQAPVAADANTAQPSGDAALGGFEQLLSALTDQQVLMLKSTPVATGTTNATATDTTDSGSALPITGIFLPLLAAQSAASKTDAAASDADEADTAKTASTDKDDTDQSGIGVTLLVNPSVVLPAVSPTTAPTPARADDLVAELAALTSFGGGNASAKSDQPSTSSPRAQAAISASADTDSSAAPSASIAPAPENPITAALSSVSADTASDSDFGALLKQLDAGGVQAGNNGNTAALAPLHDPRPLVNSAAANTAAATATVAVPVGANGWSDAVADKVMWFSANKINSAEIHLNPSDLGPVQVRISTQNDQTSVAFSSPHAAVRDALDQALPRLRDMMSNQGIQLLDVSVGGQGAERQQYSRGNENFTNTAQPSYFSDDSAVEPVAVTAVNGARLSRSRVDAYV